MDQTQQYNAMEVRRARKRVREIRSFYINLTAYCIVIPTLIVINLLTSPEYYWFLFSMTGWGIGLFFHGMKAFGYRPFFGTNWEDRKIKQIMSKGISNKPTNTFNMDYPDTNDPDQMQLFRAQKRVKKIAGFYKHFAIYLIINGVNLISKYYQLHDEQSFFTFSTFSLSFFWGIGLVCHALSTFGPEILLGKNWEERKIREIMERNKGHKWN